MPRFSSPYVFTEARRIRWIKEGRGQGDRAAYRPWLQTRNVKSRGRKHRMRGILHDRVMHLMSDLERNAVLHFERQDDVLDIKEQFPLDRDVTRRIARAMGVQHPTDPASKVEIVMTTDLLVVFARCSDRRVIARPFSVKQAKDLLDPRTLVKQEIERRYWERLGLRWNPLLDGILRDRPYFEAIRWARDRFYMDRVAGMDERAWQARRWRVLAALECAPGGALGDLLAAVERTGGFGSGEALSTLRHLIARKLVDYDFNEGVPTLETSLALFSVCSPRTRIAA